MAISFTCGCGKSYRVDDSRAGKRTCCPACNGTLVVPPIVVEAAPEIVYEIVEDDDDDGQATYGVAAAEERRAHPLTEDDRGGRALARAAEHRCRGLWRLGHG